MLALGMDAFDQDMQGGWRPLAERPGCEASAADLIREYREFAQRRIRILFWHEGQLRANLGQNDAAAQLMAQSRTLTNANGWNHYVDATIAFLRRNRRDLEAARARLAALPPPTDFREERLANGYQVRWPPNLDIVDGFVRCFDQSYRLAMGMRCRRLAPSP